MKEKEETLKLVTENSELMVDFAYKHIDFMDKVHKALIEMGGIAAKYEIPDSEFPKVKELIDAFNALVKDAKYLEATVNG